MPNACWLLVDVLQSQPAEGAKKEGEGGAEGQEEGEVSPPPAAAPTPEEIRAEERKQAAADRAARMRMLGNIQFIGFLYKNGLITER